MDAAVAVRIAAGTRPLHGAEHSLFHPDIRLLAPFTDENPLFGLIPKMLGLEVLAATALVGGVLLIGRLRVNAGP